MVNKNLAIEELHPLNEVRLLFYDLLRRAFLKEPSSDFLDLIDKTIVKTDVPFMEESELIAEGIKQIRDYCVTNDITSESVHSNLHWDYTRLFIGPYKLPAPPWESAYRNKERLLFQEETLEVRRAYMKYSFLPVEFRSEADDHLGLELDFMYRLNEITLAVIDKKNTYDLKKLLVDQKSFLEEHLLKWVPDFFKDMRDKALTEFYVGMANLLFGFLTLDLKALNELLEINS